MDTRRLPYLVEFARSGSMREVAATLGTSTSVVSQQIAALAREVGTPLVEPDGRRARLTPAGHRLAEHARTILAAVDTARRDLDPDAEPRGVVRVAGFATAIRRALMPTVAALARTHPQVALTIREYEPAEAHAMLVADRIDLALTYDYDLAPAALDPDLTATPLWSTPWGLAVPAADVPDGSPDSLAVLDAFRDRAWIGNSRNPADEQVCAPSRRWRASRCGRPTRPTASTSSRTSSSPASASACCRRTGPRLRGSRSSRSPRRRSGCVPSRSRGAGARRGRPWRWSSTSSVVRRRRSPRGAAR